MGCVALKSWAAGLELRGGVRACLEPIPRVLLRRAALFRNPRGPAVARDHARHPYFLVTLLDLLSSPLDAMLVRHPPVDAAPHWSKKGYS